MTRNIKTLKSFLFGAPFDGTVSYRPGARFGPSAIRGESYGIETYSPYLERDLEELSVCDAGDLELPFGSCRKALDIIGEFVFQTVNDGKFPLMTGGEHLVSLGAVEALSQTYPDLHILHFDAHADLREDYLGDTLSHACVLRRCHEILGDDRIVQLGIRSMTAQERAWAKVHVIQYPFDFSHLEDAIKKLCGVPVYLTLDLECSRSCFFSRYRYAGTRRGFLFGSAVGHSSNGTSESCRCRYGGTRSYAGCKRRIDNHCL